MCTNLTANSDYSILLKGIKASFEKFKSGETREFNSDKDKFIRKLEEEILYKISLYKTSILVRCRMPIKSAEE